MRKLRCHTVLLLFKRFHSGPGFVQFCNSITGGHTRRRKFCCEICSLGQPWISVTVQRFLRTLKVLRPWIYLLSTCVVETIVCAEFQVEIMIIHWLVGRLRDLRFLSLWKNHRVFAIGILLNLRCRRLQSQSWSGNCPVSKLMTLFFLHPPSASKI